MVASFASSPVADEKIVLAKASGAPALAPVELASAKDKLARVEKARAARDMVPGTQLAQQVIAATLAFGLAPCATTCEPNADSMGSDPYDQDLSQRRAGPVKTAPVARGIGLSQICSQGYGKSFPVAGNTESGGRQFNRRVEVVIGEDDGAAIAARS